MILVTCYSSHVLSKPSFVLRLQSCFSLYEFELFLAVRDVNNTGAIVSELFSTMELIMVLLIVSC